MTGVKQDKLYENSSFFSGTSISISIKEAAGLNILCTETNPMERNLYSAGLVIYSTTWFFSRSSNRSLLLISLATPSFTITSAGLKRLLKLLLISNP